MTAKGFTINERGQLNSYAIEPKVYVEETPRLNGRLAMIGFVGLIALEVLTGHGLIGWLSSL
jgi:hypothetical protein